MIETLFDKAVSNYNLTKLILNNLTGDDNELNFVAYHLQQCCELSIKHILELEGIKYPKEHDIRILIILVPNNLKYIFEEIDLFADVITVWEAKTRYRKGYKVLISSINKIMPSIKVILDNIDKYNKNINRITEGKYICVHPVKDNVYKYCTEHNIIVNPVNVCDSKIKNDSPIDKLKEEMKGN